MNADQLFQICNFLVLPVWLLLLVAPRWQWTVRVADTCVVPLLLAAVYAVLIVRSMLGEGSGFDFSSLEAIRGLFDDPYALVAGWIHYLAFDLFIGSWEVRDSQRLGLPHLLVLPCLVLTFVLGPVGMLAYFVLRWTRGELLVARSTA